MALRACLTCGAAFAPRALGIRHCPAHEGRRPFGSPSSRAMNADYRRARAIVLQRDAGRACQLCGEPGGLTSVDHIVPVAHGGTHDLDNLQAVHPWCNSRKGGATG